MEIQGRIKKIKRALFTIMMTIALVVSNVPMTFAQQGNTPKGHVTISVEKFTLGLGYIQEPIKVPFYEGDNYADIVTRALGEGNYQNTGTVESRFYLSAVKDNETREPNIPQYILDETGPVGDRANEEWLSQFDYTNMSGWMYAVDNSFPDVGASERVPQDGEVCRWQFTVYGLGADLGSDGFGAGEPLVTVANKDDLTEKVAEINSAANKEELLNNPEIKEAYDNAYEVLEVVDIEQSKVDQAFEKLTEAIEEEEEEEEENPGDQGGVVEPSIPVNQAIQESTYYIYSNVPNPELGAEWDVLALARSGEKFPQSYYDKYHENVENTLIQNNGTLAGNHTEYSRVILGLSSIGKDSTNVAGYDLTAQLADFDSVVKQGINGAIFALIALDSNNYEIPEVEGDKKQATRENLIEYILGKEIAGGGWALFGTTPDPDITAMALQSLAKYQGQTITTESGETLEVDPYIDRGVNALSDLQLENGGFRSWGTENLESSAQVLVALTALGIDPKTDERFIKGDGNWIVSAMMEFYVDGGGFKHVKTGNVDGMATYQGSYALTAYKRFVKGENSLYDMTDAFTNTDVPVEAGEVVLVAPEKISGKEGTEFNVVLRAGEWPDGEFMLLDALMDIPSSVEITGIQASNNLNGGLPDFGVEDNKLRLVYANTDLDNLTFEPGDMIILNCRLEEEVEESINFKINELNLKSSSDSSIQLNVDKANVDIAISNGDGGNGGNPEPPETELVSVKELYQGDGTDLIDENKKAVAVSFLNLEDAPEVVFGEDTKLYYSEEFTNKLSNITYIAIVDESVADNDLNDISKYEFSDENESERIILGDTNEDGNINAQDALNVLSSWLRKSEAPDDKGIMVMNVTGDSKIDTSDVIAIMENYLNGDEFKVLSK